MVILILANWLRDLRTRIVFASSCDWLEHNRLLDACTGFVFSSFYDWFKHNRLLDMRTGVFFLRRPVIGLIIIIGYVTYVQELPLLLSVTGLDLKSLLLKSR